jgi:hypothetical protein
MTALVSDDRAHVVPAFGIGRVVTVTTVGRPDVPSPVEPVQGVVTTTSDSEITLRCAGTVIPMTLVSGRLVDVAEFGSDEVWAGVVVHSSAGTARDRTSRLVVRVEPVMRRHESRRWVRVRLEAPACVIAPDVADLRTIVGVTRNLSMNGALLHTFAPLPGDVVAVVVHLDRQQRLATLARSLESRRSGDGERGWLSRLQFVASSEQMSESFHRFLAAALVDPRCRDRPMSSGLEHISLLRTTTRRSPSRGPDDPGHAA